MTKATCSVACCDRPAKTRGWCKSHYMRWYKTGDVPDTPIELRAPERGCSVSGCERKHQGRGLCSMHLKRYIATGDATKTLHREHPDARYGAAHMRVKRDNGPASIHACVTCGGPARHWAYDHADPNEKHDVKSGLPYSLDPSHYQPMCVPCHKRFDLGRNRVVTLGAE